MDLEGPRWSIAIRHLRVVQMEPRGDEGLAQPL